MKNAHPHPVAAATTGTPPPAQAKCGPSDIPPLLPSATLALGGAPSWLPSTITGQFHKLYPVIDVYSRKIVAWEVYDVEDSAHADKLVRKAYLRESIQRDQLVLHSDNGAPIDMGARCWPTCTNSASRRLDERPSVSNDNAFSEAVFATLKHVPSYPRKPFDSLTTAREWVHELVAWYNHKHLHSGIKFVTPHDRHTGHDKTILATRHAVYQRAKQANPNRWTHATRNWEYESEVTLNPTNTLPTTNAGCTTSHGTQLEKHRPHDSPPKVLPEYLETNISND